MIKNKLILLLAVLLWLSGSLFAQLPQPWTRLSSRMPIPVWGCKAVVIDSLIYVIGGLSDTSNLSLNFIQVYDPRRDSWLKERPKLISRRSGFVADNYQNGILICGGQDTTYIKPANGGHNVSGGLEFFDPKKNETTIINNDSSFNRAYPAGKVINNSFYIFGGYSPTEIKSYIMEYNVSSKSLSNVDNVTIGHSLTYSQMSATVNEDIYLFGGVVNGITNQKVFKFNTRLKGFEITTPLNSVRTGGEAVYDGKNTIYVIGGKNETQNALQSVETYSINVSSGAAGIASILNYPRKNFAAVLYKDSIYVFGGTDKYDRVVDVVEKLSVRISTSAMESKNVVREFSLSDNYPNPFNAGTVIKFTLAKPAFARLDIYSLLGEHIKTLTKDDFAAGNYTFQWNGKNDNGQSVGSGTYIYRLTSDSFSQSKKMVFLK